MLTWEQSWLDEAIRQPFQKIMVPVVNALLISVSSLRHVGMTILERQNFRYYSTWNYYTHLYCVISTFSGCFIFILS